MNSKINISVIGGCVAIIYNTIVAFNFSPIQGITTLHTLGGVIMRDLIYFISGFFLVFISLLLHGLLFEFPRKIAERNPRLTTEQNKDKTNISQSNRR